MYQIFFSLFITGIMVGTGPCLATCGPILISYIAGTKRTPLGGLWCWFVFSAARLLVYMLLGFLAGMAGSALFRRFYWEIPGYIIWLASGIFISFLGVLIFLGKASHFKICGILNESLIERDTKSLIALGVLIGVLPCLPLIGVLSYITMISTNPSHGILMSAAFGLGTMVSPLIFLGMLAGAIPKLKILKEPRNIAIFRRVCGMALSLLGAHIILKTVIEYIKR